MDGNILTLFGVVRTLQYLIGWTVRILSLARAQFVFSTASRTILGPASCTPVEESFFHGSKGEKS